MTVISTNTTASVFMTQGDTLTVLASGSIVSPVRGIAYEADTPL